ncbi:MAG: hypothetical protein SGJ27_21370 [Candidatus Melainabacteria bacterium]|nr:hypothetical protein [Candidatus Melainabacteria bacterium]
MSKKRPKSFAVAAIACCAILFAVGIGFGDRAHKHPMPIGSNSGPMMDRINVVAPKFGHAPVRPATVATCREVLRKLPPTIYQLLEKGGATINLAPNIEDNWPGSGDGRKPGPYDETMGEESGRTYGRDVWLYESEKVRGSQELKTPRSQDQMKDNMYQLLGHSINDCMGVVSNNPEFSKVYYEDVDKMQPLAKLNFAASTERDQDSIGLGTSEIIGVLIGGEGHHDVFPVLDNFPKTTAYLKRELLKKQTIPKAP